MKVAKSDVGLRRRTVVPSGLPSGRRCDCGTCSTTERGSHSCHTQMSGRQPSINRATVPMIARKAIDTPGHSLPPDITGAMTATFGHDLSGVRIHDNPSSAAWAALLGADAYSVGHHIVFGARRISPRLASRQAAPRA